MSDRVSLADKIRRGDPLPRPLSLFLQACTPLTRLGMWQRAQQPRVRVDARVISFGNITAGGTGKTPAVIARVQQELANGHAVAVLTRGYGSPPAKTPEVLRGNDASWDAAARFGDEPALIVRKAPEALIVKCTDRVAAAQRAIELGYDTLILDDGFQYLRLERDENIVLIDATNPFGGGHLLPRGLLREPLSGLARATEIVLTRCDQAVDLKATETVLRRWNTDAPIRRTWHAPGGLWRVANGESLPLDALRGQTVKLACAIGNPEAFRRTVESLGARVVEVHAAPDHGQLEGDALHTAAGAWVIVTEKDAVRLNTPPPEVYALAIALQEYTP